MKSIITLSLYTIAGSLVLFYWLLHNEDHRMERRYPFQRNVLSRSCIADKIIDLAYNSYYIAGINDSGVFLGNVTAPLHVLEVDRELSDTLHHVIRVGDGSSLKPTMPEVRIWGCDLYLTDGHMPAIYRGAVKKWEISKIGPEIPYFTTCLPISPHSIIYRVVHQGREYELGRSGPDSALEVYPDLLVRQKDGIFCTDGMLLSNNEPSDFFYVYHYRNEFICFDAEMNVKYRSRTIDPIDTAQIETVATDDHDGKEVRLTAPPLLVNRKSCASDDVLYIFSNVLSINDTLPDLKGASIVDLYHVRGGTYRGSLYLKHPYRSPPSSVFVYGKQLYAVFDRYLARFSLPSYDNVEK